MANVVGINRPPEEWGGGKTTIYGYKLLKKEQTELLHKETV